MFLLAINPTSGRGKGALIGQQAANFLSERSISYQIVTGANALQFQENLNREALNATGIIAVGGDGLLHMAIQIAVHSNLPLATIPAGTGNDFVRALGWNPIKPLEPLWAAITKDSEKVDLGNVDGEYFGAIASTGFDSIVNERANQMRWPKGPSKYNVAMARELPKFKPLSYKFNIDGKNYEREAMLIAAGNGNSYGGGMLVCPDANLQDGLLDLMILNPVSKREFISIFPSVYEGKHINHPQVEVIRAKEIYIEADAICYADGERIGPMPATISVSEKSTFNMAEMSPSQKLAAIKARGKHPIASTFFETFDFDLDDFQIKGCFAIEAGKGVLVAAPTGAGKTIVGEFAAYLAINQGKKCFYTTPIKALSNQKYQEFVDRFGEEKVGLLTGDNSINSDADIMVMTTEVLRNMLYTNSSTLINLGFVVMDEVHYLADKFRGAVWEEVLIHLMESVQVISLSATVSNAEEFGDWLLAVRGDTEVIVSENRPVPLYQHVLIGNRLLDLFNEDGSVNQTLFRSEREALRRIRTPRYRGRQDDENRLGRPEVIEKLQFNQMLPVITFIFSRQGCDAAVKQCLAANLRLTSTEEREEIRNTALKYTTTINSEDLELLGHHEWLAALERGIAAHHAGLLPVFKSCVEELFQRGLLKAIFATETLALGINMPARTVLLEKLTKWNGEGHVPITPGEYTQLTGRAGRRGIDIEGNAVVMWSPTVDSASAAGLAATRTYPLRSSFSPTYNMSINLLERYGRDRARNSLKSSFAQFQADRAVVGLDKQIRKNSEAISDYNTDLLCHLGDFSEYAKLRREIKQAEILISKRSRIDNKQRAHLEQELAGYRKAMRQHACHSCNDREAHARIAERADRLIRENEGLTARVENRTNVIAKTFDRVTQVLNELGYLDGDQVTASGKMLSKIYAESDLSIAETINSGVLDKLSDIEIASVLSIFLFESRKPEAPKIPNTQVQDALKEVVSIWAKLHNLESEHDVKTQKEPDFGFCWIAFRWGGGHGLNSVLRNSDLSVGDFVRSTKQLIDLLNQVAGARPELREKCLSAIKKLDRGVVVYLGGVV